MSPRTTATVVVTGGFGRVGTILRPGLGRRWKVHVVDRDEGRLGADEDFTRSDLSDGRELDAALAQADALIHLAGLGNPRASWDEVFANVSTTDVVLRAAADHGIRRIVLASSIHAMGEYNRAAHLPVSPDLPPRPCCAYGASKVVNEALGRLYAARVPGASVVALRLGLTGWPVTEDRYLGQWLSGHDCVRLVDAALAAPPGFRAPFGVSANTRREWDTTSIEALGYRPVDDSATLPRPPVVLGDAPCRLFEDCP